MLEKAKRLAKEEEEKEEMLEELAAIDESFLCNERKTKHVR
jgi:hypothetical protein